MRRLIAAVVAAACLCASVPTEALAQLRAVRAASFQAASVPLAPPSLPTAIGVLANVNSSVLPLTSPLSAPVKIGAAASPVSPRIVLAQAAVRLSAAAAPERSATEGRAVSDKVFSGSDDNAEQSPPVMGRTSDLAPTLEPAAPISRPAKKEPLIARWKSALTGGAGPLVAAAFAWNFLTVAAYSIIGPARNALLMTKFGPGTLPWVYLASAALTGIVVAVYSRFTSAPRKSLIGGSLAMLAATLAGGALAVSAAAVPSVAFGYYLWTDVFGIMSMTLFWTYANDVFTHEESKKTFGVIAAGAPLGSIAGALLIKTLVGSMGPVPMLMVAAGVFALVLPLFFFMERRAQGRGSPSASTTQTAETPDKGVLRTIAGSPFLIFLTLLVALERLVPDITNYLFSAAVSQAFAGDAKGLAQMFADVNFWTSIASFMTSGLLVGAALRKLGTGGSLMTAGLVNLALFAVFPFMPTLAVAALFFGLDGVARYTLFKTAKESTYSSTDKDTIYRVKAFIEMFVYRFARGLAGLLLLAAAWLNAGAVGAALLGIPLALLWLYAAWRVGREHSKL